MAGFLVDVAQHGNARLSDAADGRTLDDLRQAASGLLDAPLRSIAVVGGASEALGQLASLTSADGGEVVLVASDFSSEDIALLANVLAETGRRSPSLARRAASRWHPRRLPDGSRAVGRVDRVQRVTVLAAWPELRCRVRASPRVPATGAFAPGRPEADHVRTLGHVPHPKLGSTHVSKSPRYANQSPPEPSGPRYSVRVALSCERGHAPGHVLHALQEMRAVIDDRLRIDLGDRYDRHNAGSAGTDKLTVTFDLRAPTPAEALRSAGTAAGMLAELLTDAAAAVDLSGVAVVVRAQ